MKALVFISIAILMIFGGVWFMYNNPERSPQNTKTLISQETTVKSPQGGRAVWGPEIHVFETDLAGPLQAPQEKDGTTLPQPTPRLRDFSSGFIAPPAPGLIQGVED